MQFETALPAEALRPWVRYYWMLESPGGMSMEAEPIAPDGTFELVVHLGDLPEQRDGERWSGQAREILVGEIQRPTILRSSKPVRCIGVHFAPGGVAAFFDEPADELADRVTRLDEVSRPPAPLAARLDPDSDPASFWRALDRMLLARLAPRAQDVRLRAIAGAIEGSRGHAGVERIAAAAGISVRQLERLLRPVLGVPPKRFARVVRFHHAFSALLAGDRDAALDGYFDESHFLRDLREFASAPSRALVASPMRLNRAFAREARGPDP